MTTDPGPPRDPENETSPATGDTLRFDSAAVLTPPIEPVPPAPEASASWFSLPGWSWWGATPAIPTAPPAAASPAPPAVATATTVEWLSAWWATPSSPPAVAASEPTATADVATSLDDHPAIEPPVAALNAIVGELEAAELEAAAPGEPRAGFAPLSMLQSQASAALIGGIRLISAERDREEIIRWFVDAREILAKNESTTSTAAALYSRIDTLRMAQLLTNTVATSFTNYWGSNLPLALKVALPVTAAGITFFGAKGAGLVAFGSAVGLPVTLLIFLGTAGVTSVVEAFVKDRGVRDPLTRLLLTFVAFETSRRAKKELIEALRTDVMTPQRAETPTGDAALLDSLLQMDPVAFERHVMSFFEQAGHPTGLTPRSNDFGVDGYVMHPDGVVIVQCKRYALDNPVGRPAVQQFKGVVEEQRAYRGYIVTTSRFTDGAIESAGKNDRLILIDGDELLRWHLSNRPALRF